MPVYEREIVGPVPIEEAFAYLARFSTAAEWDPGVERASMATPEPVGPGSQFDLVATFLGNRVPLRYTITGYDPPTRVVLEAGNRSVRSVDTITLRAVDPATTAITYRAALTPRGRARVLAPVFAVALRRIGDRAADGLTAALARPRL